MNLPINVDTLVRRSIRDKDIPDRDLDKLWSFLKARTIGRQSTDEERAAVLQWI